MKQRRFPVVPVTLLVVLIGGAIVMTLKPFDAVPPQAQAPEQIVSDSREKVSTADISKIAREQTNPKKPGPQRAPDSEESTEPALLLPATMDYKPTPNPTATSQQWYKDRKGGTPN